MEALVFALAVGCCVVSFRLTLVTRRLRKLEASHQQVVSIVSNADPETFHRVLEAQKRLLLTPDPNDHLRAPAPRPGYFHG